jgi:hypothetical protein
MLHKICSTIILTLLAGIPVFSSAYAGGWAVITLDQLPEQIIAGESVEIGFMLRGHGITPVAADGLSVEATHMESGVRLSVPARSDGIEGHYLASLNFPQPGAWEWGISAGPYGFTQPMPILDVLAVTPIQQTGGITLPAFLTQAIWLLASLSIATAVLLFIRRVPVRWVATVAVVGLGIASFGLANSVAPVSGQYEVNGEIDSLAELGTDLFVAKGCVVCHHHAGIPASLVAFQTNVGPDLSDYTASAAFLQLWLSSPAEVKPKTLMPDLGLNELEIEALISFLNDGS